MAENPFLSPLKKDSKNPFLAEESRQENPFLSPASEKSENPFITKGTRTQNPFLSTPEERPKEDTTALGRIFAAGIERFSDQFQQVGFSPETENFLVRTVKGDPDDPNLINQTIGRANRTFLNLVEGGLAAAEVAEMTFRSSISTAAQTLQELGVSKTQARKFERDANSMLTAAELVFGMAAPATLPFARNAVKQLPKAQRARAEAAINAELESARLKIGSTDQLVEKPALNWADRQITRTLDGFRPIKKMQEEAKDIAGESFPAGLDPYRDMRLTMGSKGTIQAVIEHGTLERLPDGDLVFNGKGLKEVFRPLEGKLDRAMLYFAGRRARELKEQGREKLFTEGEINAMLEVGEDADQFAAAFSEYQAFNQRLLDFAEQSGLLNAEQKAKFLDAGQNYVPFYRVAEGTTEKARAGLFKRLKGGEANVNDILENITRNTAMIVDASVKNAAKQRVYDVIDQFNLDQFATKISRRPEFAKVVDEKLRTEIEKIGGDPDMVPAFVYNRPIADNVDVVFRNGKREFYEINDPLFMAAMRHNQPVSYPLAIQIMSGFKNVLTRGVTLAPDFMVANLMRDTQAAFVQSRTNKFIPLASSINGLRKRIARNDEYWELLANGGGFSTLYKGDVLASKKLRRLYARAGISPKRVLNTPAKVADWIEEVTASFEEGTRLAEFTGVRRHGQSRREAAFAAREVSTDFAMRGSSETVKNLMATLPFTNARMQGLFRLARKTKENPGTVAVKGVMAMTIPALTLYALNKDDDRYRELPDWVKDNHYVFLPDEGGPVLTPKGFEYGAVFATVPERMFEAIEQKHGTRFADAMLRMFHDTFSVGLPQMVAPVADLARNTRFGGTPIVPADLEQVQASEQFRPWTSDTMRELAQVLSEDMGVEISPLQAEHLVTGYLGTLGMYFLDASDAIMRDAQGVEAPKTRMDQLPVLRRFMRQEPIRGTSFESDFYTLLGEGRTLQATLRKMIKEGRDPDLDKGEQRRVAVSTALEKIARRSARFNHIMRLIQADEDMSAAEKRRRLDAIQAAQNKMFSQVMKSIPTDIKQEEGLTP